MAKRGIDVALTQLDVVEATGNNDGVPAERYTKQAGAAWCAAFCVYCNAHSDEQLVAPTSKDFWEMRSVATFEKVMKARGWFHSADEIPERGAYVFFGDRGASDAAPLGRHMGIVEELQRSHPATPINPWLRMVEGNLGNRVQRVVHDLSNPKTRARITGWARVPLKK